MEPWILDSILSRIPDSLSCIPDSKAQDSGFHEQNFPGFRIPQAKFTGFRIPQAKFPLVPDSTSKISSGSGIRIPLHWAINNCQNRSIEYIQQSKSAIKHRFLSSREFKFTCFRTFSLCNNVASYRKQGFPCFQFFMPFLIDGPVI